MLGSTEIENRFGFHKATIEGDNATLPKHAEIRLRFRGFAEFLDDFLPDGRAKSLMFTELENASMWAHKSVAELSPLVEDVLTTANDWAVWQSIHDPELSVNAIYFTGYNAQHVHKLIESAKNAGAVSNIPQQYVPDGHWVVLHADGIIDVVSVDFFKNHFGLKV